MLSVGIVCQLGIKGPKGDTGATGLQGPIGPQGPAGTTGASGTSTSRTETNNQVQVSGTIIEKYPTTIDFKSITGQVVRTTALISNGQYSTVIVGGLSYAVTVTYISARDGSEVYSSYTIYVPTGGTTFTAEF